MFTRWKTSGISLLPLLLHWWPAVLPRVRHLSARNWKSPRCGSVGVVGQPRDWASTSRVALPRTRHPPRRERYSFPISLWGYVVPLRAVSKTLHWSKNIFTTKSHEKNAITTIIPHHNVILSLIHQWIKPLRFLDLLQWLLMNNSVELENRRNALTIFIVKWTINNPKSTSKFTKQHLMMFDVRLKILLA